MIFVSMDHGTVWDSNSGCNEYRNITAPGEQLSLYITDIKTYIIRRGHAIYYYININYISNTALRKTVTIYKKNTKYTYFH